MARTQKYLNHLLQSTGITPACSEEERAAADVIADIFRNHGFTPEVQEFTAAPSSKTAQMVLGIALFVAAILMGLGGAVGVVGLLLSVAVAVLNHLERNGRPVISRLGASGLSQNVIAYHQARGPMASPRNRPVVVVAHYDSPRADLFSQEPFAAYRPLVAKLAPYAMVAPAVIAVVRLLPLPGAIKVLLWLMALAASLVPLAQAVAIIANRFALPYTTGSVCNKSSVASLLGVMDAVAPYEGAEEFPRDRPFDEFMAEQEAIAAMYSRPVYDEGYEDEYADGADGFGPVASAEDHEDEGVAAYAPEVESAPVALEPAPVLDEQPVVPVEAVAEAASVAAGETGVMEAPVDAAAPAVETDLGAEPVAETEVAPEDDGPSLPLNVEGNYRFGGDVICALGMVGASCVFEYDESQFPQPEPAPVAAAPVEEPKPAVAASVVEPARAAAPDPAAAALEVEAADTSAAFVAEVQPEPVPATRPAEAAPAPVPTEDVAAPAADSFAPVPTDARISVGEPVEAVAADVFEEPAPEPEPEWDYEANYAADPVEVVATDYPLLDGSEILDAEYEVIEEPEPEPEPIAESTPAPPAPAPAEEHPTQVFEVPVQDATVESTQVAELPVDKTIERTAVAPAVQVEVPEAAEAPEPQPAAADEESLTIPGIVSELMEESRELAAEAEQAEREQADADVAEGATAGDTSVPAAAPATQPAVAAPAEPAAEPAPVTAPVEVAAPSAPAVERTAVFEPAPSPVAQTAVAEPAPAAAGETRSSTVAIDLDAVDGARSTQAIPALEGTATQVGDPVDALMQQVDARARRPLPRNISVPSMTGSMPARPRQIPPVVPDASALQGAAPVGRTAIFDISDPSITPRDPFLATGAMPVQDVKQTTRNGFTVIGPNDPVPATPAPEPLQTISAPTAPAAPTPAADEKAPKRGFARLFGRKKKQQESMSEWLGVDEGFDAKRTGGEIGSWDNFDSDDDGWQGGATGAEGVSEDELRDAITSMGDDELLGHDIWFVATGASEYDHAGINAFLDAHRDKLRGVFLINLESVGAGRLAMLSTESDGRVLKADRRISRLISRVSADFHSEIGSMEMPFVSTDATAAMKRSLRACTIAGVDATHLACSHSEDDQAFNLDVNNVQRVADVVTEVIRRS